MNKVIPFPKENEVDEIDVAEALVKSKPQIDCRVVHKFTNGMYSRKLFMPADAEIVGMLHRTEHQWVALLGRTLVYVKGEGWIEVVAPDDGTTVPGTRRVFRTITPCVWITFHPTDIMPVDDSQESLLEAVSQVEEQIIEPHDNLLIGHLKVEELQ